jgi:hypothetical protein
LACPECERPDAEVVEQPAMAAIKVTLAEGEKKTQDIRMR